MAYDDDTGLHNMVSFQGGIRVKLYYIGGKAT